ncbi:SCP-like extracellular protein, putative [Penicillium digitatum]|uniref:SCP-like extracellular protein, putative n=1 Tax=Penicillium digitatum TaxID=36651 RepID=A0A7T6XNU0_PENDI|nr:SCP-like extracellular protein, putative [Penicillium digitatum]
MDRNNHTKTTRWLVILMLLTRQIFSANADIVTVWTTVKVPAPTPTAPLSPSYTSLNEFKDDMLKITNEYRANHDANPLKWNDTLAEYSREWAEACIWKHSKGSYGENLAYGYQNVSAAVIAWGDEGEIYNFGKPTGFTEETGHFTQLVWKSTTQVGCAAVNCRARRAEGPGVNVLPKKEPAVDSSSSSTKSSSSTTPESSSTSVPEPSPNAATSTTIGSQSQSTGGAMRFARDSTLGMMLVALGTVGVGRGLYI